MSVHQEQLDEDEDGADRDRRVGDVERPEVPAAPVDVHEVDDVAGVQPIDQIAERAAENEREADARQPLVGRMCRA